MVRNLLVLALAGALIGCTRSGSTSTSTAASPSETTELGGQHRPSFVIVLTDDQVIGTVAGMPNVRALANDGTRFTDAIVSNPLCCPSRTTIFTGLYSHDTGVYTNQNTADGGYAGFIRNGNAGRTLARRLQRAGYRTGLFGKYLNHYDGTEQVGWDTIHSFVGGDGSYYDYDWGIDGAPPIHHGSDPADYSTHVIGREALTWLRSLGPATPFLLYVAPYAPHGATTPAPADVGETTATSFRSAAYDESDVRDKPAYIRALPRSSGATAAALETWWDREYATLLSVDRWVGRIRSTLTRLGRADDTYVIFLSDNGSSWGDHRWISKEVPYQRSVRVPFIVSGPGTVPGAVGTAVGNVDIAATILDLADLPSMRSDGVSLVPLLTRTGDIERAGILLEHEDFATRRHVPTYCGIQSQDWMYTRYVTGEEELYDLRLDPNELRNIASRRPNRVASLRAATYEAGCDPALVPRP